jgi:hypothetical protein
MIVCHEVILWSIIITAEFLASATLVLLTARNSILMASGDVMFVPNFVKINFIPKQ